MSPRLRKLFSLCSMMVPTRAVFLVLRERFSVELAISLRWRRKARAISACTPTEQPFTVTSSYTFCPQTHSPPRAATFPTEDRVSTPRSPASACTPAFFISTTAFRANRRSVRLRLSEQRAATARRTQGSISIFLGLGSGYSFCDSRRGLHSGTFTDSRRFFGFPVFRRGITIYSYFLLN